MPLAAPSVPCPLGWPAPPSGPSPGSPPRRSSTAASSPGRPERCHGPPAAPERCTPPDALRRTGRRVPTAESARRRSVPPAPTPRTWGIPSVPPPPTGRTCCAGPPRPCRTWGRRIQSFSFPPLKAPRFPSFKSYGLSIRHLAAFFQSLCSFGHKIWHIFPLSIAALSAIIHLSVSFRLFLHRK